MATNNGKKIISPNEFYEGQRVKDKDNPDYIKFMAACGKEVDKMIVQLAKDNYLSYTRTLQPRSGGEVEQVIPVMHQKHIALHFIQLEKGITGERLTNERKLLADIILNPFKDGWEFEHEKIVMDEQNYEYSTDNLEDLNMRKGDVAKILTDQHRNRRKEILRKIRKVHGKKTFDITRKRGRDDGLYDRNARGNNKFYIIDSPYMNEKTKVNVKYIWNKIYMK